MTRLVVKLRDLNAVAQTMADVNLDSWHAEITQASLIAVVVPLGRDEDDVLRALRGHANVVYAGVEPVLRTKIVVNETFAANPSGRNRLLNWHHSQINTYRAWELLERIIGTRGNPSIKVGVIDTGLDHPEAPDHPVIAANDLYWGFDGRVVPDEWVLHPSYIGHVPGWGWAPDEITWWRDDQYVHDDGHWVTSYNAHGEMCITELAAPHNGVGVAGVAPDCHHHALSCRYPYQSISNSDLIEIGFIELHDAFYAAADRGLRVISLSIGDSPIIPRPGDMPSDPTQDVSGLSYLDAFQYAWSKGCITVVAAGNEETNLDNYTYWPAELPYTISVGAQDGGAGGRIDYSNYGSKIDIMAPTNVGAATTLIDGSYNPLFVDNGWNYWSGTGTSSSTPVTAGVIALIWSMNPSLTREQVIAIVFDTVSPFLNTACETTYFPGASRWSTHQRGIINAGKAVTRSASTRADQAGRVFPYCGFLSKGWTNESVTRGGSVIGAPPLPPTVRHTKDGGNNVQTVLGNEDGSPGTVWIEVTGYRNDAEVDAVEFWLGGRLLYSGPPALIEATAASDGAALPVKVVARSGSFRSEETHTDIVVSSLTSSAFDPVAFTAECSVSLGVATFSGTCEAGATITVDGVAATKPTGTTWTRSVSTVSLGDTVTVSDGTDAVTLGVAFPQNAIPGSLSVDSVSRLAGEVSGSDVVLDAGEYAEWTVDAGLGGDFDLGYTKTGAGTVSVSVDGEELDPLENLITDTGAHPMQALAKPALGATYVDPSFGTTIRRISDVQAFSGGHSISPSYSSVQAWNCDETYLILYHDGNGMHLYDGRTYAWIKRLTGTGFAPSNETFFYWHPTDPKLVYFVSTSTRSVKSYNVETQAVTTVHDFTGTYSAITVGNDPMWRSWIRNRLGLVAGSASPYTQVVLDLDTGSVVATASVAMNTANAICMAPSGDRGFLHIGGSANEPFVYDAALTQGLEIPNISGGDHGSIGTSDGEDTFFNVQYGYQTPPIPGQITGQLLATSLVTRATRQILPVYPMSGTHISAVAHNKPGWLAVSIIGDSRNGQAYRDQELLLVNGNTGGLVYRIGHHRSTAKAANGTSGDYYAEPHPVISPSGSRVLFASNWSTNGGAVDSYVVELPT